MDRTIKTFRVDYDLDGVMLSGICRWVGEHIQVEMIAPMEGIITHVCKSPFQTRMNERSAEDEAIEDMQGTFFDLLEIDRNIDEYRKVAKSYQAFYHKMTRRNAELRKTLAELESQYADHAVSRKEYRLQKKLLEDSLMGTGYKLQQFRLKVYSRDRNLPKISPDYVCQIIRWIDRYPVEARKLIDTYTEKYVKNRESFVREEEERKKAETQNENESKQNS